MIFRNIVFSSLIVGLIAGLVHGAFQQLQVSPIIFAAEEYEVTDGEETVAEQGVAARDHHNHDHTAWSPEQGAERATYSMLSNVLVGMAFAMLLVPLMALHNFKSSKPKVDTIRGIGWGMAAMIVIFVAPAMLGLHPEVPGTVAAVLENRQLWWIYCALATAAGIALLYYGRVPLKLLGAALVALPHLTGAPHPTELTFANTAPEAVVALTALSAEFYTMTAIGMAIFFLTLGALSGYVTSRFVNLDQPA